MVIKSSSISKFCPKCDRLKWIDIKAIKVAKNIKCSSCKETSSIFEWGLEPKGEGKETQKQDLRKHNKGRTSKYLYCPQCKNHTWVNLASSDRNWYTCPKCKSFRHLNDWMTEFEYNKSKKKNTHKRIELFCPECNKSQEILTTIFEKSHKITCISCKKRSKLKSWRYTKKPGPVKKIEVKVKQQKTAWNETKATLTFKVPETCKSSLNVINKSGLEITLKVLGTGKIKLSIVHKEHPSVILEMRICDNYVEDATEAIESMCKKMLTGNDLKRFLGKRVKYAQKFV